MTNKHILDDYQSIPEAFFACATNQEQKIVFEHAQSCDSESRIKWNGFSYKQVSESVLKIAKYLSDCGVKKGDKVAIISQSRPEWLLADLAILSVGAVSVSVYQTLPATDIGYILYDAECKFVFAENKEQVQKLIWLQNNQINIAATEERPAGTQQLTFDKIICFEHLDVNVSNVVNLSELLQSMQPLPQNQLPALQREDLATFVYTSGTTGPPKGVVQTHGNHLSNCRQAWVSGMLFKDSSIMVFLPLAHSFAKLMGYLGVISDCYLKFPRVSDRQTSKMDPDMMTQDIRSANANIIPIVPRLLEKMQSGIIAKSKVSGLSAKILKLTIWAAKTSYYAKINNKPTSLLVDIVFNGTVAIRQKIKQQLFGSHFSYAISGGAKLNPETGRFFDMFGIEVLEGYGLTETCVATNVNPPGKKKIGSVGPVLDKDIELKIASDGEILYRGPNIAKGYYKRAKATAAAWDQDGWFHTGDLGEVDEAGYLSIVGRKKDLLVSSYGKNIAPEPVEATLKSSIYISQAVLIGDGRAYCIAIVSLEYRNVKNYLNSKNIPIPNDFTADQAVRALIESEINQANKELPGYEQVKKFIIATEDFTIENGLLTPTFKVKKKPVLEMYSKEIEDCYRD